MLYAVMLGCTNVTLFIIGYFVVAFLYNCIVIGGDLVTIL